MLLTDMMRTACQRCRHRPAGAESSFCTAVCVRQGWVVQGHAVTGRCAEKLLHLCKGQSTPCTQLPEWQRLCSSDPCTGAGGDAEPGGEMCRWSAPQRPAAPHSPTAAGLGAEAPAPGRPPWRAPALRGARGCVLILAVCW